jgi:DNA uptake protein ComE-like DNA-binding protein
MKRIMMIVPALALLACAKGSDTAADTSAAANAATPVGATTQTAVAAGEVNTSQLVDPNTATREQLVAAGLDTVAAAALVAGRPYADMVAVDRALPRTVTPDQRKALYARIWKPIDLNTAKADEILLIPGVGRRMLHEFEEYRPYKSMEQFRREIGKYVDKTELARLEQYVSIK